MAKKARTTFQTMHPEYAGALDAMMDESDRGCVLLGATLLEWGAGEMLRHFFLDRHDAPTDKVVHQIRVMLDPTDAKSALGNAAARYRMCFILGLVSEQTYAGAKAISHFRNAYFAHSLSEAKFGDARLRQPFADLSKTLIGDKGLKLNAFAKLLKKPREFFQEGVIAMYYRMQLDSGQLQKKLAILKRTKDHLDLPRPPQEI